jgi:hypothetical protein
MVRRRKKLHGVVEKIIRPTHPSQSEKAQIAIKEADDLYREIRVDNTMPDEKGGSVGLKQGAEVDVTIEADSSATLKKPDKS